MSAVVALGLGVSAEAADCRQSPIGGTAAAFTAGLLGRLRHNGATDINRIGQVGDATQFVIGGAAPGLFLTQQDDRLTEIGIVLSDPTPARRPELMTVVAFTVGAFAGIPERIVKEAASADADLPDHRLAGTSWSERFGSLSATFTRTSDALVARIDPWCEAEDEPVDTLAGP